jgi:Tol biopolymer transport system component
MQTHTRSIRRESERSMVKSEGLIRRGTTIAAGLLLAALLVVLVLLWGARPAEAAFPGANGKIAYEYDTSSEQEIYAMDAEPFGDHTKISDGYDDSEPAWSADGQQIAFTSDRDGDYDIYVMDTDPSTKDTTRITKNDTWDDSPDWSPNGNKIAFGGYSGIIVKNSDGSGRKRLPDGSDPAWSPNGRKIAFIRVVSNGEWGPEREIFVMNRDGSGVKRLTGSYDHYSPTWQPIVPSAPSE